MTCSSKPVEDLREKITWQEFEEWEPIGSMYAVFAYTFGLFFMVNVII